MSIYRLDLDALEESEKEHEQSATKVNENIEDIYSVINEVNEDIYSGDDGDTFRSKLADFVVKEVIPLQEKLTQIKTVLADGLSDAKSCKKLCNDFVITLGGAGNGKSAEDMQGELYCDQSVINELKGFCRSALSYSDSIRTLCTSINDTLWELVMVKLYPTPYTSAIKEGCDKVDRLEDHSRELDAYATAAETIDSSFQGALDGCVPDFFLGMEIGLGVGEQNVQTEIIMGIMGQQGTLSETDKAILDEQLKILEEKGDIEELKQVAEHAGNGENEAWTAGDAYVMAYIYNYAENNVNAELATVVYDKMKKVTYVQTTNSVQPPSTIFTYEFRLDENKVEAISAELDPEKDGLAYYSLQRRSKYCETKIIVESGMNVKAPEMELTIQFTQDENGRLVSVFTVDGKETRLASVDMNEVVGEEGKNNLKSLGYSKEGSIAFMSSIYTDEDIPFIGELTMAKTEEDYREIFQYDPDLLGVATKLALYNYSVALVDKEIKYDEKMRITNPKQDFSQFENFVNGMLYKKSDQIIQEEFLSSESYQSEEDYRAEYLESLIMCGEIQMDILRYSMKENYEDKKFIRDKLALFAENTQVLSLYATLAHRMCELHKYDTQIYARISGLGIYEDPNNKVMGADLNNYMFSYSESMMENDAVYMNWPEYEGKEMVSNIQIVKVKEDQLSDQHMASEYVEKAKAARFAVANSIFEGSKLLASKINKFFGWGVDGVGIVESVASIPNAYQELDQIENEIYCKLGGAQIKYNVDKGDNVDVLEGQYDANVLLKISKLEKEGFAELAGAGENNKRNIAKDIEGSAHNDKKTEDDRVKFYGQYLLWSGNVCPDKNGKPCDVQEIWDIEPDNLQTAISLFERNYESLTNKFDYSTYDMITEYYLGDENE